MNTGKGKIAMSKQFWTTEITTSLILLYENYPCLYNFKLRDYHNRVVRMKALTEIMNNLKEMYPEIEINQEMIQKKIHGIRTQFNAEINKIKKSEVSGASSDSIYKPKLWCFEMLSFLYGSFALVTEGESNLTVEIIDKNTDNDVIMDEDIDNNSVIFDGNIEEISEISFSPVPSTSRSTVPSKTKKRKIENDKIDNLLLSATEAMNVLNKPENENDEFTRYLNSEMSKIKNVELLDDFKENILMELFKLKKMDRHEHN